MPVQCNTELETVGANRYASGLICRCSLKP